MGAVASFSLCPHLPIESESYYSNICSSTIMILENGSKGANFSKAGIQWGQTHSARCKALPIFLPSPSPVMFGDPREAVTQLNLNNLSVQNPFLGCLLIAVVEPPGRYPVLLRNIARFANAVQVSRQLSDCSTQVLI